MATNTLSKDAFVSLAHSIVANHAAQRKHVRKVILAAFNKAPRRSLVLRDKLLAAFRAQDRFYREQCRELKAMLRTHGDKMAANTVFADQAVAGVLDTLGGLGGLIAGMHGLYGQPCRGRKLTEATWQERLKIEHSHERVIEDVLCETRSRATDKKIKALIVAHRAQMAAA